MIGLRSRPPSLEVRIVTANIGGDPRPNELLDHLDTADVVALIEASRGTLRWLRDVPGYTRPRVAGRDTIGDQRSPALIANKTSTEILRTRELKMRHRWQYREKTKPPRPLLVTREITDDVLAYRVIVVHFPTYGRNGKNAAAWRELEDRLIRLARNSKVPTVIVGDFNAPAAQLTTLARAIGGTVIEGGKVDHAIVTGGFTGTARRLGQVNGWHGFLRYDLKAPVPATKPKTRRRRKKEKAA